MRDSVCERVIERGFVESLNKESALGLCFNKKSHQETSS